MFFDASFRSCRKRLFSNISNASLVRLPEHLQITFAISLQPLFSPRICCNFCSSSGVQGVLVLPFFFVAAVSGVAEGARAPVVSMADEAEASAVSGELALFEARRFRGFVGVADVGARVPVSSLVTGGWLDARCADILVGDVAEADDLCRLCAGGDLKETSSEPRPCFVCKWEDAYD